MSNGRMSVTVLGESKCYTDPPSFQLYLQSSVAVSMAKLPHCMRAHFYKYCSLGPDDDSLSKGNRHTQQCFIAWSNQKDKEEETNVEEKGGKQKRERRRKQESRRKKERRRKKRESGRSGEERRRHPNVQSSQDSKVLPIAQWPETGL